MSLALASHSASILERVQDAESILVALDFDGTLAPIASRPEEAAIPPRTASLLQELTKLEQIYVAILSGRPLADLRGKIQIDGIYAGNHGLEIEGRGVSFLHEEADSLRCLIDHACWDLEAALDGVRGVWVERKGITATVHYRQAPGELEGWITAAIRVTTQPYAPWVVLQPARKAWEVRPAVKWHKGSALGLVLSRIAPAPALLVCAGDDATDEDMFAVRADAVSIQVGGRKNTAARYHVKDPAELATFLERVRCAAESRHEALSTARTGL